RRFYQHKRQVMERALARELGDQVTWPAPRGGFFLWATFPGRVDTESMLSRAIAERVVYVAGSAFFVDGRTGPLARLSFSAPSPDRIDEGIRRLGAALRNELQAAGAPVSSGRSV